MSAMDTPTPIEVRLHPAKGRCVVATADYRVGDVIEQCHAIVLDAADEQLQRYAYRWSGRKWALLTGRGMLYNHSSHPNAEFVRFFRAQMIHFIAIDEIPTGREITVDYGWTEKETEGFND